MKSPKEVPIGTRFGFNSLQTGKRIQRSVRLGDRNLHGPGSFNSLQTGKRIQSLMEKAQEPQTLNSFNSLQTGKRIQRRSCWYCHYYRRKEVFQFPSNGKAYPKYVRAEELKAAWEKVSIPFKRESGSKARYHATKTLGCGKVSIPFKRESVSKAQKW